LRHITLVLCVCSCIAGPGSLDRDGDGYAASGAGGLDCDDQDPSIHPDATEICHTGVDEDCDGVIDDAGVEDQAFYVDNDRDEFGDPDRVQRACVLGPGLARVGSDCDDDDPARHPGADDSSCDGVDQDCDDRVDEDAFERTWWPDHDRDGFGDGAPVKDCARPPDHADVDGDCDDRDASRYPGASELCDGIDQDCTGQADEALLGSGAACPASSCTQAHTVQARTGEFWLGTRDQPFQVTCMVDERDGPGWMLVDLDLVRRVGEVEGELLPDAHSGQVRLQPHGLVLDPGAWSGCGRNRAARDDVVLPIEFRQVQGSFVMEPWVTSAGEHAGLDTTELDWGDWISEPCSTPQGAVLFGTPGTRLKRGGEWGPSWGGDPRALTPREFTTFGASLARRSDTLRWAIIDSRHDNSVGGVLTDLQLYVR